MSYSELQLIRGCIKGNLKQQRALYDQYKVPLFMLCLRYARNKEEAEDMLQEGFISIFRDIKQYDVKKGKLMPWLRKVMLNASLQYLRKHRTLFNVVDIDSIHSQQAASDDVFAKMSAKELIELIQALPDGYRVVFSLYVLEGYKHQEIAKILKISENTSKSQLHKAKAMLRNKIKVFRMVSSEPRAMRQ